MLPLSSRVRRRNQACSLGFVAPRSGSAFRGANVRAAVRLPSRREMPVCCVKAFLLHHRFRAAWSAGMGIVGSQKATNFAGCQFGPCSIRRERQPNNSLKRTVQSLRDWSCRLARSLGIRTMHVRAAIFDMDGTLIDSERVIMAAWMSASREAGIPLNASQYSRVIGLNDEESNELLISLLGGEAEFLAVRSAARQKLQERSGTTVFPLKEGVRELLGALVTSP